MRKTFVLPIVALSLCWLVACSKQATDTSPVVSEAQPVETTPPNSTATSAQTSEATAQLPAEPEMDYGDWLRLPSGLEPRYTEVYPTLVRSAIAGDASGQMNLAIVSQQIGTVLARGGDSKEANAFLVQSGRALRAGLAEGYHRLPASAIANIFFSEACALSQSGNIPKASAALSEAVEHGFTNLSAISSEEDLLALRESEGFSEKMEVWQAEIAERFQMEATRDLASGESFPFELSGTSIDGSEVSLEALKGKVVIVDIWGTWCPPCRAEIPSFVKLQDKYGEEGFQMVGLNYEKSSEEENVKAVVEFSKEMGINYPCLLGDRSTLTQVPSFSGYPTTLFIDKSGKVRMKAVGLHDYFYLEAVVSKLLSE